MKAWIVNPNITVLTFTVMFLIYGILSLGYTDETDSPHFHEESTTRYVTLPAVVGTNVGASVQAHSVGTHDRYRFRSRINRFSLNPWTGQLTIRESFDRIGEANTMTVDVLRQEIESVGEGLFRIVGETRMDSIEVVIEEAQSEVSEADALPSVSSEERSRIAAALAMDRVIFNELHNATTDAHDWVELRNVREADVTLDGWEVRIVASEGTGIVTLPSGTVLPAGGLLLLVNTDPDAPEMPLSNPEGNVISVVDTGLILPQANFTLLLRSDAAWEDSVGNYFFDFEIPPTAPLLTMDAAWYRARPETLGYQAEAWVMSGYQDGIGYDAGLIEASALGTPGYPQTSLIGDVNGDGTVNIQDLVFVASHFGEAGVTEADLNNDGIVNIQDLVLVSNVFGRVMDTQ